MSHDAAELPVLIPVQQDGRTVGGRRRNDVLALVVVESLEREQVLSAAAASGLVVAEASSVEQAISLLERVGFDLIVASPSQLPLLRERLEAEFFGTELPVLVDALTFCSQGLGGSESLSASGEGTDTLASLRELAALCSFTSTPMTVLLAAVENPSASQLEPMAIKRLLSCVRDGDVVGHLSPGIIAVGLAEAGRDDAASVVQRIREALASSPVVLSGGAVEYLSVSLGSASGSPELTALSAQATQALAAARLCGPGRSVLLP